MTIPVVGGPRAVGAVAAGVILAARMLLYARNQYGQDGSDQMILVVMMGVLVAQAANDHQVAAIAMAYVAGQLLLWYVVAGTAEAIWRGGDAMIGVLSTEDTACRRSERSSPAIATSPGCWSVITFECGCPLLLVAGTPGSVVLIVAGLVFHVGIDAPVGLIVFLWRFAAAYPAVFMVGQWVDGLWGR